MGDGSTASSPRSITRDSLAHDLKALGVREGDCVMLHSSLSSLGWVEGGADAVVEAFLDAIGPEGTLLTPAFTQGAWTEHLSFPDCQQACPQRVHDTKVMLVVKTRERRGLGTRLSDSYNNCQTGGSSCLKTLPPKSNWNNGASS